MNRRKPVSGQFRTKCKDPCDPKPTTPNKPQTPKAKQAIEEISPQLTRSSLHTRPELGAVALADAEFLNKSSNNAVSEPDLPQVARRAIIAEHPSRIVYSMGLAMEEITRKENEIGSTKAAAPIAEHPSRIVYSMGLAMEKITKKQNVTTKIAKPLVEIEVPLAEIQVPLVEMEVPQEIDSTEAAASASSSFEKMPEKETNAGACSTNITVSSKSKTTKKLPSTAATNKTALSTTATKTVQSTLAASKTRTAIRFDSFLDYEKHNDATKIRRRKHSADALIKYHCFLCNLPFINRRKLFEHGIRWHVELKISCEFDGCPKKFHCHSARKDHVKKVHFRCKFLRCNKGFWSDHLLQEHIATCSHPQPEPIPEEDV